MNRAKSLVVALAVAVTFAVAATGQDVAEARQLSAVPTTIGTASPDFGWVADSTLAAHPELRKTYNLTAASVHPDDSGIVCKGEVCFHVYGTKLHVTQIKTQAAGNVGCIRGSYFIYLGYGPSGPLERYFQGPVVCPDKPGDGFYYSDFHTQTYGMPYTAPGDSTAGSGWEKYSDVPTARIEA